MNHENGDETKQESKDDDNKQDFNSLRNPVIVAVDILRKAVQNDNAEEYETAEQLYSKGNQWLMIGLKYEHNERVIAAIKEKHKKYANRAEEIRKALPHLNDLTVAEQFKIRYSQKRTGTYLWKIPNLSNQRIVLLLIGFTKRYSVKYIPDDVMNLCIMYYTVNIMHSIKNAQNEQYFASDTFNIGAFKWKLVLYPNGTCEYNKGRVIISIVLVSISPTMQWITFYCKLSLKELDINHDKFSSITSGIRLYNLSKDLLSFDDIQKVDTLTIELEMNIIRIKEKDRDKYDYETQPMLIQNPCIRNIYSMYKWRLTDIDTTNEYQYDSNVFTAVGFKWFLDFYPTGLETKDIESDDRECQLFLNIISKPTKIKKVVIGYKIICKELKGRNIENFSADFSGNKTSSQIDINLTPKILEKINTLTFVAIINLIDVYDKKGLPITDKYENMESKTDGESVKYLSGSYVWKIFDTLSMEKIKNANNCEVFYSQIFKIESFKFVMKIMPNIYLPDRSFGSGERPYFGWHLYLASMPTNIESICLRHRIKLNEVNIIDSDTWTFKIGRVVALWNYDKLYFDEIQNLDSFTFKLDVDIFDIYDKDGNNIDNIQQIESQILSLKPEEYEWKIRDITMIELLKDAENGILYQSDSFMLHGLEWFLSFYPNGKNTEDKGAVILCVNLKEFGDNISSISFHVELLFVETNTLASTYTHFKHDFKSKGWTKYRLKTTDIQNLHQFTIKVMIKLVDVFDSNGYAVTYKYNKNK